MGCSVEGKKNKRTRNITDDLNLSVDSFLSDIDLSYTKNYKKMVTSTGEQKSTKNKLSLRNRNDFNKKYSLNDKYIESGLLLSEQILKINFKNQKKNYPNMNLTESICLYPNILKDNLKKINKEEEYQQTNVYNQIEKISNQKFLSKNNMNSKNFEIQHSLQTEYNSNNKSNKNYKIENMQLKSCNLNNNNNNRCNNEPKNFDINDRFYNLYNDNKSKKSYLLKEEFEDENDSKNYNLFNSSKSNLKNDSKKYDYFNSSKSNEKTENKKYDFINSSKSNENFEINDFNNFKIKYYDKSPKNINKSTNNKILESSNINFEIQKNSIKKNEIMKTNNFSYNKNPEDYLYNELKLESEGEKAGIKEHIEKNNLSLEEYMNKETSKIKKSPEYIRHVNKKKNQNLKQNNNNMKINNIKNQSDLKYSYKEIYKHKYCQTNIKSNRPTTTIDINLNDALENFNEKQKKYKQNNISNNNKVVLNEQNQKIKNLLYQKINKKSK